MTENSGKASEVRHGWQAELGREALVAWDGVRLDGRLARSLRSSSCSPSSAFPSCCSATRCQAASRTTTSPFIVRPVQAGSVAPRRCRTCCSPTVYAGSPPPETWSCCRRRRTASLRLTLSKAAIAGGAKGLQFVRVSAWRTDPACAELSRQIQANALANRRGIPWWMLAPLAAIPVAIALGYARYRRAAKRMRRGQTLRGSELLSAAQFNRLKRGDGVGFSTRDTRLCSVVVAWTVRTRGPPSRPPGGEQPLPPDGRHRDRQVVADSTAPRADRRSRRGGDRLRPGARVHAAVLQSRNAATRS